MHICSTRSPIAKSSFSSILLLHWGSEVFRKTSTRQSHFSFGTFVCRMAAVTVVDESSTGPITVCLLLLLLITSVARDDRRSYHHDCRRRRRHDYHQSHRARRKSHVRHRHDFREVWLR